MSGFEGETLCRDIFPAELAMPDQTVIAGVRVFITSRRLIAYGEQPGHGILSEPVVDLLLVEPGSVAPNRGSLTGSLQCDTPTGRVWVNRGRGCGCHSPLKALGSPVPWRLG